jgi:hypothetical protein
MLTADQIRQRLDDAERTIATGEIDGDPHEYIEILWAQVHEEAPDELQPEISNRLLGFSAMLRLPKPTVAAIRLASPRWYMFLAALDEAPDTTKDALLFWRHIDHAKAPLFEGVTSEDRSIIEAAVQAALNERGLATPNEIEP